MSKNSPEETHDSVADSAISEQLVVDEPLNIETVDGEEVFGVVDPTAIASAKPVVGRRGRNSDDSDSDEAYAEDEDEDEEDEEEEEEEYDSEFDDDYSDDEGDYDEYEEADGEEYGRNRKHRPGRYSSNSLSYQPARTIRQPQLPPVLAALTDGMIRQKEQFAASSQLLDPSHAPASSFLNAAQLQEMARNAVSSLAAASGPADKPLPVLLPRTPQATENIREHVSQELKQSIATMLMNPDLRAALIAKLQANKATGPSNSSQIAPKPLYSDRFINYQGPNMGGRRPHARPDDDENEEESYGTITSTRARRTTRSVDYSKFFGDDAFESPTLSAKNTASREDTTSVKSATSTPGSRRGRPPKSHQAQEERQGRDHGSEIKKKARHMYDEGSEDELDDDALSVGSSESSEPGIEKILSHRRVNGKDEFFVKFRGLAYIHAEWIGRDEIVNESAGASRVSRFLSKPLSHYHFDDKNIFNPEFVQVDRIIYGWQHPDPDNERKTVTSYLVKWAALPLDQATWEKCSFVKSLPDGPDAIKQYDAIPNPWKKRENALPVTRRPDASQWTRLEESPAYKSENTLRIYQLEGLNWLVYCWMHRQSCIIADEMGLGKTVQTVSFLDLIYNRFRVRGPFLVVAPLSTIPHWQREFAAWTDLRVLVYHGSEASRDMMFEYEFFYKDPKTDQIIPGLCKFDVILTTYEMTLSGQHHLRNIIWRVGVFDEAHRLKNKASKAAEVLQTFQIEHKVLLTGTPIQNSLEELFSLLNFLQPHRFFSMDLFLKEYGNLRRSEDVERLQGLLKPLMLRRLKEDVEKSIPVKEETIIEVELTSIQKRYYRAILEKNFGYLMKGAKANNMPNLINTMMELRKCCIHPYLIKGSEDRIIEENGAGSDLDSQMNCLIQASGKLVLVDKLLKKLREGGHKVLIFSQMTRCLDILSDFLRWRGYPTERIDGAIRGDERQAAIDRYCDPTKDSFVFLLCTKAGGVGINLTAADTVVIFDSDWNPQNDLQAQARCHRIGQTKSVKIYRLITRNTYEREMFDRAGMKLGLDKAILQKMGPEASDLDELTESSAAPQLSKSQVEDLLKKGAYGILMENDDADMKFMNEDIDSILERRTTVVKHDAGAGSSRSAMDGSIFSKASFAATADDLDLDLDDPNFWELWAKKMNVDPKLVHSSNVATAVDESRIRRVLRRLQTHAKTDFGLALAQFPCALTASEDEATGTGAEDLVPWSVDERSAFVRLLMRFGLSAFHRIKPFFPQRSLNDLVAAAKVALKLCIEEVGEEEPKFREDSEKLLLSKIEFARADKKTSRQAALAAAEASDDGEDAGAGSNAPVSAGEFSRADVPYSGATRRQILEFRSFIQKDAGCPEEFKNLIKAESRSILIILQVVEMLRSILEELGGSARSAEGINLEAVAALTIPNSAGNGPTEWWERDEDLALLVGTIRHGFGEFEAIQADSSLSWNHLTTQTGRELPTLDRLYERLLKLVIAIEKRNRASAKLAAHAVTFGGSGRRRDDDRLLLLKTSSRRKRRGEEDEEDEEEDDDDDEAYEAPLEEKRGRGRPRRKKTFSGPNARFLATWSKSQRAEFNRVLGTYGLPPIKSGSAEESPEEIIAYDWSVFRELMKVKSTAAAEIEEEDTEAENEEPVEGTTAVSDGISGRSDEDLDKYTWNYLRSCKYALERPGRKRGRPSKSGKVVDEDEDEDGASGYFYDDSDEEMNGDYKGLPSDSVIEMAPERARKSMTRIELFRRLRAPELLDRSDLDEILQNSRRSSGLPRWWVNGEHDAVLLAGAAKYGFGRPDLLVRNVPKFLEVFDGVTSGDLAVRESRRKVNSDEGEGATPSYPIVDGIDVSRISWPNELIILRRLELLVELLENVAATGVVAPVSASDAKGKRGRKSKETKETKKPKEPKEKKETKESDKKGSVKSKRSTPVTEEPVDELASSKKSPKKRTSTAKPAASPTKPEASSPRKRRAAAAIPPIEMPASEEFPKIHPGRKRQKTLTDFGFGKRQN